MKIEISYTVEEEEIPEDMARKIEQLSYKLEAQESDLASASEKIQNEKISSGLEKLDEVQEEMRNLMDLLDSYKSVLMGYEKIQEDIEEKRELIDEYGPNVLQKQQIEAPQEVKEDDLEG